MGEWEIGGARGDWGEGEGVGGRGERGKMEREERGGMG